MNAKHIINCFIESDLRAKFETREDLVLRYLRDLVVRSVVCTLATVYECTYAQYADGPERKTFAQRLLVQAVAVARHLAPQITLEGMQEDISRYVRRNCDKHGILLVRLRLGHKTGIEKINGFFVRQEKDTGVSCSTHAKVIEIIIGREQEEAILIQDEMQRRAKVRREKGFLREKLQSEPRRKKNKKKWQHLHTEEESGPRTREKGTWMDVEEISHDRSSSKHIDLGDMMMPIITKSFLVKINPKHEL